MKTLSIDIETFSPEPLAKCGVYRYCQAPEFEVLLFGYSVDSGPVRVVDLTAGECIPADVLAALTDPAVSKWAFNAQFERVCLSRYLGYPVGQYLDPDSWYCTMVWSATLGLPLSLEGAGAVLGLEKQKLKEGKDLVRYFCTPAKARDGSTFRRPYRTGCILHDMKPVPLRQLHKLTHGRGQTEQVHWDYRPRARTQYTLDALHSHIEGSRIHICKYGMRASVFYSVCRCYPGKGRHDHLIARPYAQGFDRQMQSCGSRTDSQSMNATQQLPDTSFKTSN